MKRLGPDGRVSVRLVGGLGNQLFQYATARAIAERLHCGLTLDLSLLHQQFEGVTPRRFELDAIAHVGETAVLDPTPRVAAKLLSGRRAMPGDIAKSVFGVYREAGPGYDGHVESIGQGVVLEGYFQSHLYFSSVAKTVADEMESLISPSSWFDDTCDEIRTCPMAVAVHIRRGDYATESNARYHGVLGRDYYNSALAWLFERNRVEKIFVFTDEPDSLPKDSISWPAPCTVLNPPSASRSIESLLAMSKARSIITANSSFSWWAGWLGSLRRGSSVLAPYPWFKQASTPDLVPPEWNQVEHRWKQ